MLQALHRDGYAVVRSVVSTQELHSLRTAFDSLYARAETLTETTHIDGTQFVIQRRPFRLRRAVWAAGISPELAALGDDPRFLALAAQALGSKQCVQLISQAHFKMPGDGVDFAFHQDASNRRYGSDLFTDVNGAGSFVQLALAMDAMTPTNGPLKMVPGSHTRGFVAHPRTGALPPDSFDPSEAVDLTMEPGDVAVFGPFVIHGSAANEGDTMRRLFLQGYASVGANRRVYPGCGTGVLRSAE